MQGLNCEFVDTKWLILTLLKNAAPNV